MMVSNVVGGLSHVAATFQRAANFGLKRAEQTAIAATGANASPSMAAMRQVLSQYNLTNITPNNFANLVQQLSAKGAISPKDAQQLASVPGDLQNSGVGPDESVNVVQFYQQQLEKIQETAGQSTNAATQANFQQLVAHMQSVAKLALMRQSGGASGVNAVV